MIIWQRPMGGRSTSEAVAEVGGRDGSHCVAGDLPDAMAWLQPLTISATAAVAVPTDAYSLTTTTLPIVWQNSGASRRGNADVRLLCCLKSESEICARRTLKRCCADLARLRQGYGGQPAQLRTMGR